MNEMMHAFLVVAWYREWVSLDPQQGREGFRLAVRQYGEERGRRMARRALRDGRRLDHPTCLAYGELRMTDEVPATVKETVSVSPDFCVHILQCPWHEQFRAMGAEDCGAVYCREIDRALYRGFNPEIPFESEDNLNEGPFCIQRVRNVQATSALKAEPVVAYQQDFRFHCAHLFCVMAENAMQMTDHGMTMMEHVLRSFVTTYGKDQMEVLKTAIRQYLDRDTEARNRLRSAL